MYLTLIDSNFRTENYNCDIYINDKLIESSQKENKRETSYHTGKEENVVKICYTSKVLANRWGGLALVMNWFVSVLTGGNEDNFLGKPYDATLTFRCKDTSDVEIMTNPIWNGKPFTITGEVEEMENEFYAKRGYKARWGFGIGLPIVFFITLLCIFFATCEIKDKFIVAKWLLTICFAVGDVIWCGHVLRVLLRHKIKEG